MTDDMNRSSVIVFLNKTPASRNKAAAGDP